MSSFWYVLSEHFLLPYSSANSVTLHSSSNHLLSTSYALDLELGTGDTILNNKDMVPALMGNRCKKLITAHCDEHEDGT